ncbi:hypothetical protein BB560_003789 [Smittium megazygosporum]|uniref:Uncharacterized protein n=1 Tax=Smittium megazygosporum TaxID=133381 RepID=A0A2T9ZB50_9FUNG|nr:hypothetical protein BB560_003789 [Smittium megazygosporum]
MNNENYSEQSDSVPELATSLFYRIYMLQNFTLEIENIQLLTMKFRPSVTIVQQNYTDEYVVERLSARYLTPSAELLQLLPEIKGKFFSFQIQYDLPQISNVKLSHKRKQLDSQFANIQYKLSGTTRPIDYYAQNIIANSNKNTSKKAIIQFSKHFINKVIKSAKNSLCYEYENRKGKSFKRPQQSDFYNSQPSFSGSGTQETIVPILLGIKKESRDSIGRKANLVLRDILQDNHQHLGSESSNPGIQNPILLASSNQGRTKVENFTLKQEQKKCDRNRSFKPSQKQSVKKIGKTGFFDEKVQVRFDASTNYGTSGYQNKHQKNDLTNSEGKYKESQEGCGKVDKIWKIKDKEPCFRHIKSSSNNNCFIFWSIDSKTTTRPQEQRYKELEILGKNHRDRFPTMENLA